MRGPDFYGLPRNEGKVSLIREEQEIAAELPYGDEVLVPMRAGETTRWRIAD